MKSERPETLATPLAAPRYALGWAMLVCAIAALTLCYPALSGGFLVNVRSDQYLAGFAFRDFAAQTLKADGHFPLWNPYLTGGIPYVGGMHGDVFYPTFILRWLLPTDVAMTWGMILHFWLAGVAAYAFFRAHAISFHAALIGGVGYMMCGQVGGLVSPGHDGKLFITALFPITLLVLRHGMRFGKAWAWGVLALVVGLAVLTPHPQLLQYLLLASGAYALWMAYFEGGEGAPTRADGTKRLAYALGAVMIGFAIGAIQFWPLIKYTPWSPRASGHDWETATSFSMPPEETINWFLPQFSGILNNYWGRNGFHYHSEYLGLPLLLLAAAAFGIKDAHRKRMVWFATGLLVISWLWSLGGFTPLFHIFAKVPGTMYFRAPSTIMFESAFAIALLAAFGADRLLAGAVSRKFLVGAGVVAAVVGLAAISGTLTSLVMNVIGNDPNISPERVDANRSAAMLGSIRMMIFAGGALALMFATSAKNIPRHVAAWSLVALIGADIWSVERNYWQFSAPASTVYASDPIVERIQHDSVPGRVVTMPLSRDMAFHDPFLVGDAFMGHHVRLLTGYQGNEPNRYLALMSPLQMLQRSDLAAFFSGPFAQLTNLRWLYTNDGNLAAPFEKVVGPIKNSAGTTVWLYKVPGDNPPAWVVPALIKAPDEISYATLTQRDAVRRVAFFDTSATVTEQKLAAVPEPLPIRATATRYDPGAIDIALDAPAPAQSALVVSENFYPGWTATIDGKPALVDRADYTFMGVPLPAGARTIELRFTDPTYERGKAITLAAIALAIFLAMGGVAMDRRTARA